MTMRRQSFGIKKRRNISAVPEKSVWDAYGGGGNAAIGDITAVKTVMRDYLILDGTYALAVYEDTSDGNVSVALIDHTTGSVEDLHPLTLNTGYARIARLSDTKAVLAYDDNAEAEGIAVILSASAGTLSAGTGVAFATGAKAPVAIDVAAIDATSFVVAFSNTNDSNSGQVAYCAVSGTTITANTAQEFTAAHALYTRIVPLSGDRVLVAYSDIAADASLKVIAGTITTGTGAISYGSAVTVKSASNGDLGNRLLSLAATADNNALLSWIDEDEPASVTRFGDVQTLGGRPYCSKITANATALTATAPTLIADKWWHWLDSVRVPGRSTVLISGSESGIGTNTRRTPGMVATVNVGGSLPVVRNTAPFADAAYYTCIDALGADTQVGYVDCLDGYFGKAVSLSSSATPYEYETYTATLTVDTGEAVAGTNYHLISTALAAASAGDVVVVYETAISDNIQPTVDGAAGDPITVIAPNGCTWTPPASNQACMFMSGDDYFDFIGFKLVSRDTYAANDATTADGLRYYDCVFSKEEGNANFISNILGPGTAGEIAGCILENATEHGAYFRQDNCVARHNLATGNGKGGFRTFGDNNIYWGNKSVGNETGLSLSTQTTGLLDNNRIEWNVLAENSVRNLYIDDNDPPNDADYMAKNLTMLHNHMTNATGLENISIDENATYSHTYRTATGANRLSGNATMGDATNSEG